MRFTESTRSKWTIARRLSPERLKSRFFCSQTKRLAANAKRFPAGS
jgi:hypothetical protein